MAGGAKLTRKQEQAIAALLSEPTHDRAAEKADVNPSTLTRWLQLPEFQTAFREARARVLDETVTRLARLNVRAVKTLKRNLTCGTASVEVRAAVAVLEQSVRLRELSELEERLAALEAAQRQAQAERDHQGANGRFV